MQQSGKLSVGVSNINIKVIEKVKLNTKFNIQESNHMVRKNAHFFIYLVLGILVVNALRRSNVLKYKSITLLICILYTIGDEVHQIFVPGRGPGVRDVFIDSAGAIVGILVYLGLSGIKKKIDLSRHFSYIEK